MLVLLWRWIRGNLPRVRERTETYIHPVEGQTYISYLKYCRAVGGVSAFAWCHNNYVYISSLDRFIDPDVRVFGL